MSRQEKYLLGKAVGRVVTTQPQHGLDQALELADATHRVLDRADLAWPLLVS